MPDIFATPVVQAATGVVVLCILIAAAFYLVSSYRDYVADDQEVASEVLSNLQEMHRKGDISDEEFRTIQSTTHRQTAGSIAADDAPSTDEASANNRV